MSPLLHLASRPSQQFSHGFFHVSSCLYPLHLGVAHCPSSTCENLSSQQWGWSITYPGPLITDVLLLR